MKKSLVLLGIVLLAISTAISDEIDYDKEIKWVQYIASYNEGPAQALYLYLSNGLSYRYLFNAAGNSSEHARSMMAMLLSAQATGRNINIHYTSADLDGTGSNHGTFFGITVR